MKIPLSFFFLIYTYSMYLSPTSEAPASLFIIITHKLIVTTLHHTDIYIYKYLYRSLSDQTFHFDTTQFEWRSTTLLNQSTFLLLLRDRCRCHSPTRTFYRTIRTHITTYTCDLTYATSKLRRCIALLRSAAGR